MARTGDRRLQGEGPVLMAVVNLSPESFHPASIAAGTRDALERIRNFVLGGAGIIDLGAVSTRPGAPAVSERTEWRRLRPVLVAIVDTLGKNEDLPPFRISIDTTRASIVRKAYRLLGEFIVNDISAGEDDPEMLPTVAKLGLSYIAMHKRGTPRDMDQRCSYPEGVVEALVSFFRDFGVRAAELGIRDWILDPGLGFAKTPDQCWEILQNLPRLKALGRPVLIGSADKRFTRQVPLHILSSLGISPGSIIGSQFASLSGSSAGTVTDMISDSQLFPLSGSPAGTVTDITSSLKECSPSNIQADPPTALESNSQNGSPSNFIDGSRVADLLAVQGGADILRIHHLPQQILI